MIAFEGVLITATVVGTLAVVLTFVVRGCEIGADFVLEEVGGAAATASR
ncbi:MAG: hypothetical protein Q7S25_05150 [Candidatus Limnocylindria bacterium]|nr:hypothetical protein [Candidatus Limnocylindria bacterium]